MEMLAQCVILAVLIEAIWETGKLFWQNGRLNVNQCGVTCLAVGFALVTRTTLFRAAGIAMMIPLADEICTGLLLSRDSNFFHDLVGRVQSSKRR